MRHARTAEQRRGASPSIAIGRGVFDRGFFHRGVRRHWCWAILPGGWITFFVLAIFLAARRAASLILGNLGIHCGAYDNLPFRSRLVDLPSSLVEPVTLHHAFVAIENLVFKETFKWRPGVVFLFGLIHGLGFASFFADLELPTNLFWSALIGFNIGVEVGQLSVVLAAAVLGASVFDKPTQEAARKWVVRPGSGLIGLCGLWWASARCCSSSYDSGLKPRPSSRGSILGLYRGNCDTARQRA
ncbi:MAG: hypothetical protein CM15mP120_04670 [Pseudomonadota bacterium]|nr:MAG: hypothetical protein CM15mP120_04670 [Pseudomonadota bacterium]